MDHRPALPAARAQRSFYRAGGGDQRGRRNAVGRHAGDRDERDERLSRRTARPHRRAQRARDHPGLWRAARQLAGRARADARNRRGGQRVAADRAAAARLLQWPGRRHRGARQHGGGHCRAVRRTADGQSCRCPRQRRQCRDRIAAGHECRGGRRRYADHHQPRGPAHPVRHRTAPDRLPRGGDLRDRGV